MSVSPSKSKSDNAVTIIVAAISTVVVGLCGCAAAMIGLGQPIVSRLVDVYFPVATPVSAIAGSPSPQATNPLPTAVSVSFPTFIPASTPGSGGTPLPATEMQTFTGQGAQVSPKFVLSTGLALFCMKHSGQHSTSRLDVELLSSDGRKVFSTLVGLGKELEGLRGVFIEETGDYLMNVSTDGEWIISVEQPTVVTAPGPPQTFVRGQQAFPMISLAPGLATFHIEYKGSKNCYVGGHLEIGLYHSNGEQREQLVKSIAGSFSGSKAINIAAAGVYLLNIEGCGGDWTIAVEQ